jgi:hypothetical protein
MMEHNRQAALQRRALRQLQPAPAQQGQQQQQHDQALAGCTRPCNPAQSPRPAPAPPRITVHASEVAALAGLHPRRQQGEAVLQLWRRVHPASFAKSMEGARLVRVEQLAEAICIGMLPAQTSRAATRLAEAICAGMLPLAPSAAEAAAGAQPVAAAAAAPAAAAPEGPEAVDPALSLERLLEAREVRRCIKSQVFQSFGRAREDPVFELLRSRGGLPDLVRDTRVYCSPVDDDRHWLLKGRVDGKVHTDEGGVVVVEIKNRQVL